LFPALVCALFDKKANKYGAMAGLLVAFVLRFGGGDATLGIPILIPYPILDASVELVDGVRTLVLFPFRTLAMLSGLLSIIVVSRLTQKQAPPQPLRIVTNNDNVLDLDEHLMA
jgi:high affinity choline transporter 7